MWPENRCNQRAHAHHSFVQRAMRLRFVDRMEGTSLGERHCAPRDEDWDDQRASLGAHPGDAVPHPRCFSRPVTTTSGSVGGHGMSCRAISTDVLVSSQCSAENMRTLISRTQASSRRRSRNWGDRADKDTCDGSCPPPFLASSAPPALRGAREGLVVQPHHPPRAQATASHPWRSCRRRHASTW